VVIDKAEAGISFIDGLQSVNDCLKREITYITGINCRPSFWRWSLSIKA
jgi:hypothetical protein